MLLQMSLPACYYINYIKDFILCLLIAYIIMHLKLHFNCIYMYMQVTGNQRILGIIKYINPVGFLKKQSTVPMCIL